MCYTRKSLFLNAKEESQLKARARTLLTNVQCTNEEPKTGRKQNCETVKYLKKKISNNVLPSPFPANNETERERERGRDEVALISHSHTNRISISLALSFFFIYLIPEFAMYGHKKFHIESLRFVRRIAHIVYNTCAWCGARIGLFLLSCTTNKSHAAVAAANAVAVAIFRTNEQTKNILMNTVYRWGVIRSLFNGICHLCTAFTVLTVVNTTQPYGVKIHLCICMRWTLRASYCTSVGETAFIVEIHDFCYQIINIHCNLLLPTEWMK